MQSAFLRNAVVLGLLAAVGPFAIDMYLPALPSIAGDLHASTMATQMTLMAYFITFGIAQIAYGPISDMVGRRPPLYFGLIVFAIGGVGCGFAPNIEWLIFFRFLQGIGAAACMVIPRAVIRDLHTGIEATRLMSLVMLVFSVSPILAPLAGSGLIVLFGWRAVFAAVTTAAVLGMVLMTVLLPETRPVEQRIGGSLANVFTGYGRLFRDPRFMGLTFIGGLGLASFFAFLGSSSFIYIDHFGLTPTEYSLAFSVNAVGFFGASQFAARLAMRFGVARVIAGAVSIYAAVAVILLAATLAGIDNLPSLMVMLFAAFTCLGLVIPSTMVLSLEDHGAIAGMASALGGMLQFLTGAVMIVAVSVFFDGTPRPMVITIAACALGALALARVTLTSRQPSEGYSSAVEAVEEAEPAE
jgi:DHA1 family bicyclomycin/chloramphenicol resistance-like MFS transporter